MSTAESKNTQHPVSRADARGDVMRVDDPDSEIRAMFKDKSTSAVKKYMLLTVGKKSYWALFKYELLTGLFGSLPGALGLALRRMAYRRLFGRCGRGVVIGRNVTIRHPHRIHLGDRVIIDDHVVLDAKGDNDRTLTIGDDTLIGRNTILSCKGGRIELGDRVNISVNCTLLSESLLTVGEKTLIAGHAYLVAGGNHSFDRTDTPILDQPLVQRGGVQIAQHCWLGASVTILDGVTVGRDSVIAAGAVVNKPVDAYKIVAGVPAKVIRDRMAKPN